MRILAQILIPTLIFIAVYLLLYKRSSGNQAAEQSSIQETSDASDNKPLSNLGIIGILFISALVTLASILVVQQLLP